MLTNDKMKAGRFLAWHKARVVLAWINTRFDEGCIVAVTTYTKSVQYKPKHRAMFRAGRDGLYVQRGKNWDFIGQGGCRITAFPQEK